MTGRPIGWTVTVAFIVVLATIVAFPPVIVHAERNAPAAARLRADPAAQLSELSSAERRRADVSDDL
jgi:hypothetical protein